MSHRSSAPGLGAPSILLALLGLAALPVAAPAQLQLPSTGQGASAAPSHPAARPGSPPVPQDVGWLSLAGGRGTDMAQAVAAHPQGGVIAAGLTEPDGAVAADAWVARLSSWGATVWQVAVGGAQHEDARAVLVTADGGCVIAGRTASAGAGGFDAWAARLDASGDVLWQRAFGGPGDDEFFAVAPSPDGFYLGGVLRDAVSGNDAWVLELDGAGDILWQQRFDAKLEDGITTLCATADGGLVFCADSNSAFAPPEGGGPPVTFFRPWIVKLTGDGTVSWQKTYNYSGGDTWRSIAPLDDGGYVVAGEILATSFFGGDAWVARLDASGDLLWDRRFGDHFGINTLDTGVAAVPTEDGGFAVLASTESAGAGSQDVWFLKLDGAGVLQWEQTLGGTGFDGGKALAATPGGAWWLAGRTQLDSPGNTQAFVARMVPVGEMGGVTGPGCDLTSPTAPATWTDSLAVDPVELSPTPTSVVPADTAFPVTPLGEVPLLCPPM